jgi:hypothetical protein
MPPDRCGESGGRPTRESRRRRMAVVRGSAPRLGGRGVGVIVRDALNYLDFEIGDGLELPDGLAGVFGQPAGRLRVRVQGAREIA